MMWIHIDFWFWNCNFRVDPYLNRKQQKEFEDLLQKTINQCAGFIRRKFYLYEDIPHCFLALEMKKEKYLHKIENITKKISKPDFIYKIYLNTKAGTDSENGEGFLDVLNAMTDFYLFRRDNKITHIIHCCMEFIFQSRRKECKFYQNMVLAYGLKRLNPKLRSRIRRYINGLDLRKSRPIR